MPRTFLSLLVAVVVCRVPPGALGQEKGSDVFKSGKVLTLHLEIGPKEMDALRREPRKYVKATLKEGDKSYPGARRPSRGRRAASATSTTRPPHDQHGQVRRRAAVPRPRQVPLPPIRSRTSATRRADLRAMFPRRRRPGLGVAHAVVFINGSRRGLYYVKEGYDGYFLKRALQHQEGGTSTTAVSYATSIAGWVLLQQGAT
ncbi:MAG: hypothetical protein U0793_23030 [Gemmataceae bacterium]